MGRFIDEDVITRFQEELDEKYRIVTGFGSNIDKVSYNGMLRTVVSLGFDWERDESGHHTVYGNYSE